MFTKVPRAGASRSLIVILSLLLVVGCGPYRIRYQRSDYIPEKPIETMKHVHSMGPIGGGGYFFALHQMFPALVDVTGPQDVGNNFSEVSHYHTFGQNASAAFFSWLVLVNAYHESNVEIR